ncbi:DUF3060 domain-containing protein, partial [Frigoribacterium sp. Leaf164]|uniref:DUF3060 domain-containing protein n=2 Tax=unclassified Frigoribacterium TaxID=2627005 RepID=UPI001F3731CC
LAGRVAPAATRPAQNDHRPEAPMPVKTLPAALATAAAVLLAVTACTTTTVSTDDPSGAATTAESSPTAEGQPDNECVDGIAYMQFTDETTELSLPDGCGTVFVLGDGGTADLGPVGDLGVMGNGSTIRVESVGRLDLTGNDNTIEHGGDAPEILGEEAENGTGNSVVAR